MSTARGTVAARTSATSPCTAPRRPPAGLDPTFGGNGRVSTPVGGFGHGEAVVIQPSGGIVTAGWRGTAGSGDFALTRHDTAGNLDHSFGTAGSRAPTSAATTTRPSTPRYPGRRDRRRRPHGRRRLPQARTSPSPATRPTASPTPASAPTGSSTTDIVGGGDQANAVAVQPDGKIVVAGCAVRGGIDSDFALVRYNADGTPDTTSAPTAS